MKDTPTEETPTSVATVPAQVGELRARWAWTEPSVWTERMLTALETGVKGNVWFSLMDKVYSLKNLRASWKHVERKGGAAGVDRQSVENFATKAESNLEWLQEELRTERYRPKPVRRQWIPKAGSTKLRPLGIPTVRDRIVQGALRHVLEPIFEHRFCEHSYGFRPGRGCKDALRRVDELLRSGRTWVVDADIQSYFDTIPRQQLMADVQKEVVDGSVLALIDMFLEQSVMDGMTEWKPEQGTPQGAVISPLLANIYLHPVDVVMQNAGFEMVRYADDFVILCESKEQAQQALQLLEAQMTERGLKLHPEKTKIVDATEAGGFDFLGYHFERGYRKPRVKSLQKLKDGVRLRTPRNNGFCMSAIITQLNTTLRGWFEYFKQADREVFAKVDGWVRRRLRAILVRRLKKKGTGVGNAHIKWPNAHFAKLGLFSMATARAELTQPR